MPGKYDIVSPLQSITSYSLIAADCRQIIYTTGHFGAGKRLIHSICVICGEHQYVFKQFVAALMIKCLLGVSGGDPF